MPESKSAKKRIVRRVPKKLDAAKYRAVLAQAELLDVKLTNVEFDVSPAYFAAEGKGDKAVRREIGFKPQSVSLDKKKGAAVGFFRGVIDVRHKDEKVLSLNAEYIVAFDIGLMEYEAEVHAYVEQIGRIAAYPYFRQLVSSVSNMAGARLPTLPIIREWASTKIDQVVRKSD